MLLAFFLFPMNDKKCKTETRDAEIYVGTDSYMTGAIVPPHPFYKSMFSVVGVPYVRRSVVYTCQVGRLIGR